MNEKVKGPQRARLVKVGAAAALAVFAAVGVFRLAAPPAKKPGAVVRGALAFGKLPAPAGSAMAASAQPAIGRPDSEAFVEPVFEYTWSGGRWPRFPGKMAVYRRVANEISSAEAKALAAKFGLTGEPEPDEPPGAAPGGPPAGVEPGGQTAPSSPGESEPAAVPGEAGEVRSSGPDPVEPVPYRSIRFLDRASGARLEIFEPDGRFSYMVEGAWQTAENTAGSRPTDERAKETAIDFLKRKDLLPADYTGPFIADTGVVSSAVVSPDGGEPVIEEPRVVQPAYVEVQFGKKLGAYDLVEPTGEPSRYIASVTVGAGGAVMAASGEIPAPLEESAYPLRAVAEGFDEVKKGRFGVRILGAPVPLLERQPGGPVDSTNPGPTAPSKPEPVKVELARVTLAYLLVTGADGTSYFEPAYLFSGTIGPRGGGSDYKAAVPALAQANLELR